MEPMLLICHPPSVRLHEFVLSGQFGSTNTSLKTKMLRTVDVGIAFIQARIGIVDQGFLVHAAGRVVQLDVSDGVRPGVSSLEGCDSCRSGPEQDLQ